MSEIPPWSNPPGPGDDVPGGPPPRYVGYSRPNTPFDADPARIRALVDAYKGFSLCFVYNVLALIGVSGVIGFFSGYTGQPVGNFIFVPYGLACVVAFVASLNPSRQYAIGTGKDPKGAIVTSIVLALQAWFCCGALGYVILQNRLNNEMKRLGLRIGFLGPNKREVDELIARLEAPPPPPTVPPST